MSNAVRVLSPSDLNLFESCPRCCFLAVRGMTRPQLPFPKVFGQIEDAVMARINGRPTAQISPDMPAGVMGSIQLWVESQPLLVAGGEYEVVVKGRIDAAATLEDGSVAIIDFKTGLRPNSVPTRWWRQLTAYALAVERPSERMGAPRRVSLTGILLFEPSRFAIHDTPETGRRGIIGGDLRWYPITPRVDQLMSYLGVVVRILNSQTPPPSSTACAFCAYRTRARASRI